MPRTVTLINRSNRPTVVVGRGVISLPTQQRKDLRTQQPQPQNTAHQVRLFWVGCGVQSLARNQRPGMLRRECGDSVGWCCSLLHHPDHQSTDAQQCQSNAQRCHQVTDKTTRSACVVFVDVCSLSVHLLIPLRFKRRAVMSCHVIGSLT